MESSWILRGDKNSGWVTVWSPAKVNLFLIIQGRLPSGYHRLRSLMVPVTLAEKLIAYCDKFFSKSGDLSKEKPLEKVLKSLSKHGEEKAAQFMNWHRFFNGIN
jgi:4-diphosphocytidyl-2C-methyl-D-erythritol kinase